MAVVLADLLEEKHVTLDLRAATRDEALREIILTMRGPKEVRDTEKFLAEVIAREAAHTFMGDGVALPHARTELVERIVLGIGRSRVGVPWGEEGERAYLLFLIGVPQRMITDYLVCVGALARLTKDETTRAALMKTGSAKELVEILRTGSLVLE